MTMSVKAPAQRGDLCLICEVRTEMYQDRSPVRRERWCVYRVVSVSREGAVRAVEGYGRLRQRLDELPREPGSPIYVIGTADFDGDAALAAVRSEHPDGFASVDDARAVLSGFRRH